MGHSCNSFQSASARITRTFHGFFITIAPVLLGVTAAWMPFPAQATGLTLTDAERLGLENDPAVIRSLTNAEALQQAAVADGQWSDPKLKLGLYNLPLDSLSISDNPTTQLRFGLQQALPRGDTLRIRRQQTGQKASAEQQRAELIRKQALRGIRERFLEVYYQREGRRIIEKSRQAFEELVNVTQSHYAQGRVSQQDVLRAQLELSRLDDRETQFQQREETNRAALSRWIGAAAQGSLDQAFPPLPALPGQAEIQATLAEHPLIGVHSSLIAAADSGIDIAREQYKPGWNLGLEYRKRFGDDPGGGDRSDMMAAMLTVDLPLFTGNRQDRRLSASQRRAEAARLQRDDKMRDLREMLDKEYANWRRLGERLALYRSELLPDSVANSEASMSAYQSGVSEFTTLMRARITELELRIKSLRIETDRARARVRLLYLFSGDNHE